jgi:hypothetical protein
MKVAVVGTGMAGFGTVLALNQAADIDLHVFDIGLTEKLPEQPEVAVPNAKPKRKSYFTYGVNDPQWKVRLLSSRICSSHALGGHSTVYSGAILYPKDSDLTEWPDGTRPQSTDYKAVLQNMGILHEPDDIDEEFPLIPEDADLASAKGKCGDSLLGLSRLAISKVGSFEGSTVEPFNTAEYFNQLIQDGRIQYHSNCYVNIIDLNRGRLRVSYERRGGECGSDDDYDAVFLGAGCVNTTGIVDRSLFGEGSRVYEIKTVGGTIDAFIQLKRNDGPGLAFRRKNSLPEYFLEINSEQTMHTWSHTQVTVINKQIIDALDSKVPMFGKWLGRVLQQFIFFSMSLLHSRHVATIPLRCVLSRVGVDPLPTHTMVIDERDVADFPTLQRAVRKAVAVHWSRLGMIHFPFGSHLAVFFKGNKLGGWHYGGTLPMQYDPHAGRCHPSGEVCGLGEVFIVDSAAFPSIPASTVALMIAAHAHRVARQWLERLQAREQSCQ